MVAPAINYDLYRFTDPSVAPPWSDDPALKDAKGKDTEWMIWRLKCVEGLSKLTELELVLIRHEDLPVIPPDPPSPDTIFDKLHRSFDRLRKAEQVIDNVQKPGPNASPQSYLNYANNYAQAWGKYAGVAAGEAQRDWQDISNIGDIEKDILGKADEKESYWNSGEFLDPGDFVGSVMSVAVTRTDADGAITGGRWFTGIVAEFEDLGNIQSGYRVIHVRLVPMLWTLSLRTDSRIFQRMTAVEIITDVFARAGIYKDALIQWPTPTTGTLEERTPKREYCVQYNESDLNFVLRLLEEEGISYQFDHRLGCERLTLLDAVDATAPKVQTADGTTDIPRFARHDTATGIAVSREFVWNLLPRKTMTPRRATLWDYNSSAYSSNQEVVYSDDPANAPADGKPREWPELYSYPGRIVLLPDDTEPVKSAPYSKQPLQARYTLHAATHLDASGSAHSNITGIFAGGIVSLQNQGDGDYPSVAGTSGDQQFLVTSVTHHGFPASAHTGPGGRPTDVPESVRGDDVLLGEIESEYFNTFVCIPVSTPFRPAAITPRPKIHGLQTAIVLGDESQSQYPDDPGKDATNWIDIDKTGRIRVRFPWDRRDELDDKTGRYKTARSCWVRVAQNWAGDGFGTVFLPRMGMEAVVSFEDGDPDRPVVVGCVYSRVNPMPLERAHLDYRSKANRLDIENEWPKDDGRLQYDETKQKLHVPDFDLNLIRTRSHPSLDSGEYRKDGVGFNELSFDDQAGRERIRLHAELDFHEVVSRKQSTTVTGDQMNVVHGDQTEEVYGEQKLTVTGNRHKGIKGSEKTLVKGDRTEEVKASETIFIKNSRTEQVYETEQVIIGTGPEDDRLRKLTVTGNRHTLVTKDDTLLVGQKEPPVPGAKNDLVTGIYGVKGGTVAMNAKGKDPKDQPKSSINVDNDGNVRVDAHGDPGVFELTTHGEKKPEETDMTYPIELSIDGRENVILESLSKTGGISLEVGDDDKPKAMVKLTIDGDSIIMSAPKEVIFSVGPTLMRMGEQSIVFALSDADAEASDETKSLVADTDATKEKSVYYFSMKAKAEIGDPTQVPPVEEQLPPDGPAPDASPDAHKDLPGFYIHGDSFAIGTAATLKIDSDKGVNVQTVSEIDGEHHLRLRSKKEKDLYDAYKKAEKDRNDQIVVVNQKQLDADTAESLYREQDQKVDDKLKEIRAPGGPQEKLDAAQADLDMHKRRVHDAEDDVKRYQERYDKAKAKNQVDTENIELDGAKMGLETEQKALAESQQRYDDEFKEYSKSSDELAAEMSKAYKMRQAADDAQSDLRKEKDKLDGLQNDMKALKDEYDRRASYRENG